MFFNLFKRKSSPVFHCWESWMIHLLTIGCFSIVTLSVVYYVYRITPSIIGLVICLAFVIGWITSPGFVRKREEHSEESCETERAFLWIFGSMLSTLCVLAVIWISRTQDAIASPWQAVPMLAFVLYLLAAIFTVRAIKRSTIQWSLPVTMLFGLATFGVSLLVYRLGFGYDPFVHQATERVILQNGFILPKQPMYIGQYVSVVSLSWLTGLSIAKIDKALVPLLSVFVMLPMIVTAFRYGWMKRFGKPTYALIALFLIPIGYFAFTVPFNLALISLVLIVAYFPLADQKRIQWLMAALGCFALAVHPLIGLPTALIATMAVFRKLPTWIAAVVTPAILFAAFSIYLRAQGASILIPTVDGGIEVLKILFGNPYDLGRGEAYLSILYALLYLAPLLLIGIAIYGYADQLSEEASHRRSVWALGYASIGLVISAIMIPLFFQFPNIIASEQYEFSLRLLVILPLLWLPGIAYAMCAMMHQKTKVRNAFVSIGIGVLMLGVWMASYPQYNAISYLPSPGLSKGDLDAVNFIEGNSQSTPYVVLSSQMMGAAALTEYGFEKQIPTRSGRLYAYAIPTGGELYQYYLRFISGDEDPQVIQSELNQFVDTPLVYISIPDSWDPEGFVTKRLESITMSHYEIGGNRIFKLKAVAR